MRSRLVTTLLSLTLLTGGAAMALALYAARTDAEELSAALLAQAGARTEAELQRFFEPTQALLATTHEWAAEGLLDVHDTAALNARFVPILRHSPSISSMLIATEAGDEYMLLLHPDGRFENRVVRVTDPAFGVTRNQRIEFDGSGNRVRERVEELPYDPRERPWFRGALSRPDAAHWTEPYTFRTTREPGITTSRVADAPGQRLIVAFDIKLLDLSRFTTSLRIRERGWVAVLLGHKVIGLPGPRSLEALQEQFADGLPAPEVLDVPALAELAGNEDGEPARVELGDETYVGVARSFELTPGTSLRVLSALAESDVLVSVHQQRNRLLVMLLVALLVALGASLLLSRSMQQLRPPPGLEGQQVGQYKLESRLGEGGMGTVYRASHAMLRRPTAIKLLREDRRRAKDLARFEREVQLTAQLTHPNTIAIYDYGLTPDGAFYYAMEYVEGVTLQALINAVGPLPSARVIHILQQVLGSLAEAHDVGLIHRDIKPANIMLCERGGVADVVKVLDFGLVKRLAPRDSEKDLSGTDNFAGTPLYLAPESVTNPKLLDARSDLYSVAAVGYFLLTGTPVFQGKTAVETITQHLKSAPETPSARLGRAIAADLERVLLMALAKAPEGRPESAREFAQMLETCTDAHAWRQQDSRTWWRTHGAVVQETAAGEAQTQTSQPPEALTVDMTRRTLNTDPD
ncbi:MAG: protein kinase [Sandaracinaceae bacterium]|nr:protein kinase [Sandaracinaceae bacterium]MBK8412499.1 protein kinase [Sandaracinaceae bacterium]MBK8589319.1 protein kinase [Sandaracinaceae bacterium]